MRVIISGVVYLSLWSCTKVNLGMGKQLSKFRSISKEDSLLLKNPGGDSSIAFTTVQNEYELAKNIKTMMQGIHAQVFELDALKVRLIDDKNLLRGIMKWAGDRCVVGGMALMTVSVPILTWCHLQESSIDTGYSLQQPNMKKLEGFAEFFIDQRGIHTSSMHSKEKASPIKLISSGMAMNRKCREVIGSLSTVAIDEPNCYLYSTISLLAAASMMGIGSVLQWGYDKWYTMGEEYFELGKLKNEIECVVKDYERIIAEHEQNRRLGVTDEDSLLSSIESTRINLERSFNDLFKIVGCVEKKSNNINITIIKNEKEAIRTKFDNIKEEYDRLFPNNTLKTGDNLDQNASTSETNV